LAFLTHRVVAEVSLLGMAFDAMGGLYLAYDLLGGMTGPLRTLTRMSGYVCLFFFGSLAMLGLRYALIAAFGMGLLLAAEYRLLDARVGTLQSREPTVLSFGMLRGIVIGVAGIKIGGAAFGALFGLLSGVGLTATYYFGFSPTAGYEMHRKPRVSRHKALASLLPALAVTLAGLVAAELTSHGPHSISLGLKIGIAAGVVSGLVGLFSPSIEWWVTNTPERRLGVVGLGLIFFGMALQSVQYWAVVFNASLK
jgi:hypothetical protein